ncbi:UNVERIFIED_CONTAM: hypothetical protein PYX00_002861 [Menopon gallinae]|uniref:Sodium channel modifier 1 n=1 Tax=Menopon gallinae TaxID=328185 RepID=A0AAW2HYC2_9NEOP
MSFKREGNDPGLLKNLQHRRVSEILGDFIPDDEALLLSNGRLTCTICPKRPIFDTIQMLSLHRKGKNHLYELSWHLQRKRDVEYKKCKQIQKQFLKTGRLSVPIMETKESSPLAYIARSLSQSKKGFNKFNRDRKFVLDIPETCKIKSNISAPVIIEQSANSQVRHYLKSLSRKRPLEKAVNTLRASYGCRHQGQNREKTEGKPEQSRTVQSQGSSSSGKANEAQLKIFESGWIKDAEGNWVKDPEVEFDSDEDEPPTFRHSL